MTYERVQGVRETLDTLVEWLCNLTRMLSSDTSEIFLLVVAICPLAAKFR